jgi:hypothetical protein
VHFGSGWQELLGERRSFWAVTTNGFGGVHSFWSIDPNETNFLTPTINAHFNGVAIGNTYNDTVARRCRVIAACRQANNGCQY